MSKRPRAPRKNNKQSTGPQDNAKDEGVEASRQTPVIPPSPSDAANTQKREDAPLPRRKSVRWKSVLETIGIVAGIGYAIVTYLQWRDIKNNFIIDQRAWLGVTEVKTDPIGEGMKFAPILVNSGKTLASDVVQRGGWKVFPVSTIPDINQQIGQQSEFFHGVIFPNGRRELSNKSSRSLTKGDADGLLNGSSVLYVFAKVNYRDIFRKERVTRFCLMLDPETDKFVPCPFYKDSAY
jgi:hypothetical protein